MRLTHEERARGGSKSLSLIHKGEKAINPEEEKEKNRNHLKIRATGRRREREGKYPDMKERINMKGYRFRKKNYKKPFLRKVNSETRELQIPKANNHTGRA